MQVATWAIAEAYALSNYNPMIQEGLQNSGFSSSISSTKWPVLRFIYHSRYQLQDGVLWLYVLLVLLA